MKNGIHLKIKHLPSLLDWAVLVTSFSALNSFPGDGFVQFIISNGVMFLDPSVPSHLSAKRLPLPTAHKSPRPDAKAMMF